MAPRRRWPSSAARAYSLLLEQQLGSAGYRAQLSSSSFGHQAASAAAGLRIVARSGGGGCGGAPRGAQLLHTSAAEARLWLPASSALLQFQQLAAQQAARGLVLLHSSNAGGSGPLRQSSTLHAAPIKAQLTPAPPLSAIPPGGELPHQSLAPQHQRTAAAASATAAHYEAADAGGWERMGAVGGCGGAPEHSTQGPQWVPIRIQINPCCARCCTALCCAAEECDEVMEEYSEARRRVR